MTAEFRDLTPDEKVQVEAALNSRSTWRGHVCGVGIFKGHPAIFGPPQERDGKVCNTTLVIEDAESCHKIITAIVQAACQLGWFEGGQVQVMGGSEET